LPVATEMRPPSFRPRASQSSPRSPLKGKGREAGGGCGCAQFSCGARHHAAAPRPTVKVRLIFKIPFYEISRTSFGLTLTLTGLRSTRQATMIVHDVWSCSSLRPDRGCDPGGRRRGRGGNAPGAKKGGRSPAPCHLPGSLVRLGLGQTQGRRGRRSRSGGFPGSAVALQWCRATEEGGPGPYETERAGGGGLLERRTGRAEREPEGEGGATTAADRTGPGPRLLAEARTGAGAGMLRDDSARGKEQTVRGRRPFPPLQEMARTPAGAAGRRGPGLARAGPSLPEPGTRPCLARRPGCGPRPLLRAGSAGKVAGVPLPCKPSAGVPALGGGGDGFLLGFCGNRRWCQMRAGVVELSSPGALLRPNDG
jgi:hypothetical protein